MSIIAAGTTTTTALSSTGNTDGTLQLQVNGTTPSVTLNTLGAVGVGASPSFGTSGQALLSAGSTAAPAWGNVQAPLVSGTNIKTINGGSVLGSGDLAVGGGSLILLASTTTAGVATVDFTLNSTYDCYMLQMYQVRAVAVNGLLIVRLNSSVGGWTSVNFAKVMLGEGGISAARNDYLSRENIGTAYSTKFSGTVMLYNINGSDEPGVTAHMLDVFPNIGLNVASGFINSSGPITGVRLFQNNGNIAGTFNLYGIKKT
jgi:hypothetical protein